MLNRILGFVFENFYTIVGVIMVILIIAVPVINYTTVQEFDGQLVRYVPEFNHNTMVVVKNLSTGENETFDNEDNWLFLKVNSRNYFALDEGATYHFKVNWFRFGLFSQSRNILKVTPFGQ